MSFGLYLDRQVLILRSITESAPIITLRSLWCFSGHVLRGEFVGSRIPELFLSITYVAILAGFRGAGVRGTVGFPGSESRMGTRALGWLQRLAFPENGARWQDWTRSGEPGCSPGSLCDSLSLSFFICKMGQKTSLYTLAWPLPCSARIAQCPAGCCRPHSHRQEARLHPPLVCVGGYL